MERQVLRRTNKNNYLETCSIYTIDISMNDRLKKNIYNLIEKNRYLSLKLSLGLKFLGTKINNLIK